MTINLQFILHVAKLIPVFKRGQNKTNITYIETVICYFSLTEIDMNRKA